MISNEYKGSKKDNNYWSLDGQSVKAIRSGLWKRPWPIIAICETKYLPLYQQQKCTQTSYS